MSDDEEYGEGESVGGSSIDSFAISSHADSTVPPSQHGQGLGHRHGTAQRHGLGRAGSAGSPTSVATVRHVHEATARPVCVVHAHGVSRAAPTPAGGGQGQVVETPSQATPDHTINTTIYQYTIITTCSYILSTTTSFLGHTGTPTPPHHPRSRLVVPVHLHPADHRYAAACDCAARTRSIGYS